MFFAYIFNTTIMLISETNSVQLIACYEGINMEKYKYRQRLIIVSLSIIILITSISLVESAEEQKKNGNISTSGWCSFEAKEYIDYGLKVFGFTAGFGILIFQLNRQHKNSLKLQKQQFKAKVQQEIFNEISNGISQATNAYVKITSKLFAIKQKIDTQIFLKSEGVNQKPLSERTNDYIDYHHSFSNSIIELIFILEKYVITDRIFEIFNMALQSSSYDLGKSFQKVQETLINILPIDVSEEKKKELGVDIIQPKRNIEIESKKLETATHNYDQKALDITCYLHDLKVEAQNILLGEIFEKNVVPRKSNDRDYVVVSKSTTRSLDEIEHYFMHETEWGKSWQEAKIRTSIKNIS